jgi:hypothetical protein
MQLAASAVELQRKEQRIAELSKQAVNEQRPMSSGQSESTWGSTTALTFPHESGMTVNAWSGFPGLVRVPTRSLDTLSMTESTE